MLTKKAKGGKKNRKWNRNRVSCDIYRSEGRREKNKERKAERIKRRLAKRDSKRSIA